MAMSEWLIGFIVACVTFVLLCAISAWYGLKKESVGKQKHLQGKHTGKR